MQRYALPISTHTNKQLSLLAKLDRNLPLTERPRLGTQHLGLFFQRHADLVAHGDEALGEVHVVLHDEADGDHDVVDVLEGECVLAGVLVLLLQESDGVLAPVAQRVEVVRGVVAVVEAEAVALGILVSKGRRRKEKSKLKKKKRDWDHSRQRRST